MRKYVLILALAAPLSAAAQFFDHFEGNDLAPHWRFSSEGSRWEYNVRDSMLNVTRLYGGPSPPQVYIEAFFDPMADFEMSALVGWDEGQYHWLRVFILHLEVNELRPVGFIWYEMGPSWETPLVTAWFRGGGSNFVPAPRSGMHEFRMTRTGDQMTAYFNGQLVHEASGVVTDDAVAVMFEFGGEEDGRFAPLHVDRVGVVPEPGTATVLFAALVWMARRRRRSNGWQVGCRRLAELAVWNSRHSHGEPANGEGFAVDVAERR